MTTARKLESSAPRERPILFSGPMVRAILEGRKTQTRRLLKPQPPEDVGELVVDFYHPTIVVKDEEQPGERTFGVFSADGEWAQKCPYGAPGDRLWVRETWREVQSDTSTSLYYRADEEWHEKAGWRPSIHMPRWASRITLEATDVRVQRLQDISEEDAKAEGADDIRYRTAKECFSDLWDSIHGDGAWAANPWVWAITFKRVEAKEVAA